MMTTSLNSNVWFYIKQSNPELIGTTHFDEQHLGSFTSVSANQAVSKVCMVRQVAKAEDLPFVYKSKRAAE